MIRNEGSGWRLERDKSRPKFSVLIGGDNWALELSDEEWNALKTVISKLIEQHESCRSSLMPEEAISIEIELSPWWGCIDGNRDEWTLKLILSGDDLYSRGLEMFWPIPAAQIMVSAMRTMWDS